MQSFQQILARARVALRWVIRRAKRAVLHHTTTSALLEVKAQLDPAGMVRKNRQLKIGLLGTLACGILLLLADFHYGPDKRYHGNRPATGIS